MRPEWPQRKMLTWPAWMRARHVITLPSRTPDPMPGLINYIQIRRAGRWNNGDQMTGCYLTSLPFKFIRAVADFDPEWSGSYFIPRATVRPPIVLLGQVWPELDKWKEAHNGGSCSDLGVEQNMAAGAFLELLEWFREVLLQDAVFLRESYPDHPIFQDPVFSCPEFAGFASKVRDSCRLAHENSHSTVMQKAMPVVAEKLRTVLAQQTAAEQLADRRHLDLLAVSRKLDSLDEFMRATYTITFNPGPRTTAQNVVVGAHQQGRRVARETVPTSTAGPIQTPPSPEQERISRDGSGTSSGASPG